MTEASSAKDTRVVCESNENTLEKLQRSCIKFRKKNAWF